MLPVHDDFYKAVNENQDLLFEKYRKIFLKLAVKSRSSISGDFDPMALRIGKVSFYDMYHCSKSAIKTIGITE